MKIFFCSKEEFVDRLWFPSKSWHKFIIVSLNNGQLALVIGPEDPGHSSIVQHFLEYLSLAEVTVLGGAYIRRKKTKIVLTRRSTAYGPIHTGMIDQIVETIQKALPTHAVISKLETSDDHEPRLVVRH